MTVLTKYKLRDKPEETITEFFFAWFQSLPCVVSISVKNNVLIKINRKKRTEEFPFANKIITELGFQT